MEIYKKYDSLYILERNDKNLSLFRVWPFSWAIAKALEFLGDLQGPWHSVHVLGAWQKNSSFLHFRDVFLSYCPQFWSSGVIYKTHDTQYMFERHDKKLIIFVF
jgi:hypothetical protein